MPITYPDKTTGDPFTGAEATEIKNAVNALTITKATSAALATTVDFAAGIFQPKTHSGTLEIGVISNPALGTIAIPITGGTNVTIATGLIPAERIRGSFNPAKTTNILKITCYDSTTPEFYATWELEGGSGGSDPILEAEKLSSQAVTTTISDITTYSATVIDKGSSDVVFNNTNGTLILKANKIYSISVSSNYTAISGTTRSTIEVSLTDSTNSVLWSGGVYIRDSGDKSSIGFNKLISVGGTDLTIKLRHQIIKGGMTIDLTKLAIIITG